MTPDPGSYGRHASLDDVCHRTDPWCLRRKWERKTGRSLPTTPTSHRAVQVVEVAR